MGRRAEVGILMVASVIFLSLWIFGHERKLYVSLSSVRCSNSEATRLANCR